MLFNKLYFVYWLSNYFIEILFLGIKSRTITTHQNDLTLHLLHPWQLVAPARRLCSLLRGRLFSLVTHMGHHDTVLRSMHSQWPIRIQASFARHNHPGKMKRTIDRGVLHPNHKAFVPQVVVLMVQRRPCHTPQYTILLRHTTWLVHICQMLCRLCMDIHKHTVAVIRRPKVCIQDRTTWCALFTQRLFIIHGKLTALIHITNTNFHDIVTYQITLFGMFVKRCKHIHLPLWRSWFIVLQLW